MTFNPIGSYFGGRKKHSQETINTIQCCAEAAPSPTASLLLIRAACLEAAFL